MSSYDMGMMLGLKGFCAAMLGGWGVPGGPWSGECSWGSWRPWRSAFFLQASGMPLPFPAAPHSLRAPERTPRSQSRASVLVASHSLSRRSSPMSKMKTRVLPAGHCDSRYGNEQRLLSAAPDVHRHQYVAGVGSKYADGYAGQISLGPRRFLWAGAYTSAVLSATMNWSPWLALLAAIVLTTLVAFLVALPMLKLSVTISAWAPWGLV